MRILMIAPVHRELEFIKQKRNIPFLYGQGQEGWYEGLKSLGHDVSVFRYSDSYLIPNVPRVYVSFFFTKHFPVWKARFNRYSEKINLFYLEDYFKNKELEKICKKIKPELILVSGGLHGVWPKTLQKIKYTYNSKAILFSGVNPEYGTSVFDRKLLKANFFDCVFANDSGYAKKWGKYGGREAIVLPISSADLSIHKKVRLSKKESQDYESDVCFVGTLSYYRQRILSSLIGFNLKIWGDIPPATQIIPELEGFYKGKAVGEEMVKIYNCAKIVVNIHEKDMKYGGNMKTFEIPACGAMEIVDNVNPKWFRLGKDIVVFKDKKDLLKKIDYYLKNPEKRKKIADNGYLAVRSKHTYKNHLSNLFKFV